MPSSVGVLLSALEVEGGGRLSGGVSWPPLEALSWILGQEVGVELRAVCGSPVGPAARWVGCEGTGGGTLNCRARHECNGRLSDSVTGARGAGAGGGGRQRPLSQGRLTDVTKKKRGGGVGGGQGRQSWCTDGVGGGGEGGMLANSACDLANF